MGTVGVEEEFYILNEHGRPTAGIDELTDSAPTALEGRLGREQFACVIETQTPVCEGLEEVRERLVADRAALVDHVTDHGYGLAAAGVHPTADWRTLERCDTERHRRLMEKFQFPQRRNVTTGLHVHVGIDNADKATWVMNELRWYLPPILALSANSPFWDGEDSGLASIRAKIFEAIPNTGIPTDFDSFAEYTEFRQLMLETDSIIDADGLWYDVRLHTDCGTVEVRMPDAQSDVDRTMALVEYVHALVCDLAATYDRHRIPKAADGGGVRHRMEVLNENRWRALRYGHESSFVRQNGDGVRDLDRVVADECARLDIDGIGNLYEAESGTERQRRAHAEGGMDAVCEAVRVEK